MADYTVTFPSNGTMRLDYANGVVETHTYATDIVTFRVGARVWTVEDTDVIITHDTRSGIVSVGIQQFINTSNAYDYAHKQAMRYADNAR